MSIEIWPMPKRTIADGFNVDNISLDEEIRVIAVQSLIYTNEVYMPSWTTYYWTLSGRTSIDACIDQFIDLNALVKMACENVVLL